MKRLALLGCAILLGCAGATGTEQDLSDLREAGQSFAQGCSWRRAPSGFEPRGPGCWHVYSGQEARASSFDLSNVCDAPKLPHCATLVTGAESFGFFDRDLPSYDIIVRYKAAATLADGSCAPCEEE